LGLHLISLLTFFLFWASEGFVTFNLKELSLFKSEGFEFVIDFYFDAITAVFLSVGAILTYLIIRYSKYYLHLEAGYKRFFNTILLFFSGYNLTVLSGNFETLFIGWEILGLSSFMLIAFYRERYLPVRNAVKVFSVYRLGDVGILMAMWASHHLWHENITFAKLANAELVHDHLAGHTGMGVFIAVCLVVAAGTVSVFVLATEGHGRAHAFERHFLRFAFGAFRGVFASAHFSVLGRTNICSVDDWCGGRGDGIGGHVHCAHSKHHQNPNCLCLHRSVGYHVH
jgi:formate hydrogenlyase subunit 3/multisubunit Na+/H+ antiporter MnhD subunit